MMRPAALIVLVAALWTTSAYKLELADLWAKFGAVETMTFCLGQNATAMNIRYSLKALYECDKAFPEPDSDQTIPSLETANWNKIFYAYSAQPDRQAEFAPENAEHIAYVKGKIADLIKRFRCTMQRTNITDSDNNINIDVVVEAYKSLDLPKELLADLLTGVDQCNKLTQCLPQDQPDDSPIPMDVVLVKTFLNCERYMRNWACLKKYTKYYVDAGEFDFSGADGTLDFLPDDEARAAAILLANQLVGGDDYGLYE